jgi:hypothetical protein
VPSGSRVSPSKEDLAVPEVDDRLVHGSQAPGPQHIGHGGRALGEDADVHGGLAGRRVVDVDQAAPVALGPVEGIVSLAVELVPVRPEGRRRGEPAGEREAAGEGPVRSWLDARGEQSVRDDPRVLGVGVRHQHRELIAADPECPVGSPQLRAEDAAHLHEQVVSDGVAGRVVDGLEVVDVDQQEGDVGPVTGGEGQQPLELVLEGAVVGEPGQRILQRMASRGLVQDAQIVARCGQLLSRPDHLPSHPGDKDDGERERERERDDALQRRRVEKSREGRPDTRDPEGDGGPARERGDDERRADDQHDPDPHERELGRRIGFEPGGRGGRRRIGHRVSLERQGWTRGSDPLR